MLDASLESFQCDLHVVLDGVRVEFVQRIVEPRLVPTLPVSRRRPQHAERLEVLSATQSVNVHMRTSIISFSVLCDRL